MAFGISGGFEPPKPHPLGTPLQQIGLAVSGALLAREK